MTDPLPDQHRRIADALLEDTQDASPSADLPVNFPRVIVNNRPLRALTADIVQVFQRTNDPPVLFVQANRLVRVRRDNQGQVWCEPLTELHLRRRLTQVADVVAASQDGEQFWHVFPSLSVLRDVLAMDTWPFPPLDGLVETPILRPDGSLLSAPGYDPTTRLLYLPPPGFRLPTLPVQPSANDLRVARALLDEPLEGFPFVDEAAKANALALLLTPILRQAINGPVPLALIDAPQAGTGKSLLARVISLIATGRPAAMMTAPGSDEEWRKRITATLSTGTTLIVIDNVDGPLAAPSLAAALTTDVWSDRLLGASAMLTLAQRATWLATGNNIRPGGDLPRRCYWIRLDAKTSRPWQRTGFRYPDLLGWVGAHRHQYIAALLLLARAWYAAGQPAAEIATLGGFEAWTKTIGGILAYAEIPGFLSNLEQLYAEIDDGSSQWETFLQTWLQVYGDRRITVAELTDDLLRPEEATLRDALPDELAEMLSTREGEEGRLRRRLGHAFRKRVEHRFGTDDLYLARAGEDTHRKVALWRVIRGREPRGSAGVRPATPPPTSILTSEVAIDRAGDIPPNPALPQDAESSTSDADDEESDDEADVEHSTAIQAAQDEEIPYRLMTDPRALPQALVPFMESPVLAIDTETTGLDPRVDHMRLLQLAIPAHPVVVIDLWHIPEADRDLLRAVLAGPALKLFHNATFDLEFLHQVGLPVHGSFFDTMLASQILDAGVHVRRHGLAAVTHHFLGREITKDEQESDWSRSVLTPAQLSYAATDAAILLPLRDAMLLELHAAGLLDVLELECACLPAVAEMERTGMAVDPQQLETLRQRLDGETTQAAANLKAHLQSSSGTDKATLFSPTEDVINLDSPAQVLHRLQALGIPVTNTAKWTLAPLADQYPVLSALLAYRKVAKALTFATSLPAHLHPRTGRIHATYWQLGASTGRFSCSDPNLQQIPKDTAFRRCFIAAPGHRLVIADYSQIELRVVAELSGDARMMEAYQRGDDLHILTASLLLEKPMAQVSKTERQAAKAVNFGLIYGMSAPGLQAYARNIYGVTLSMQDATMFRTRFFTAYAGLAQWHAQIRAAMPQEVRTRSGRLRRWQSHPTITQLYNTPVQGTAADITKLALAWLPQALVGTDARLIGTVHDEILVEVSAENAEPVARILKDTMEQAGRVSLQRVPVVAEVRIGTSWAIA
jgi:DNA polymerase-1